MKKFISFCLGMMLLQGLMAQSNNEAHRNVLDQGENARKDISISASDIQFWCGSGNNQAIVVVGWDDSTPAIAYAWGVRWNGNAVALDLIDSIATHDSRFSYQFGSGLISNVEYSSNGLTLSSGMNYWCYYLNGDWAMNGYGNQPIANGDYIEMSATCMWSLTTATPATNPNAGQDNPTEATIDASDILYWVGNGNNQLVMAVSWAEPDTALAWGYRFSADSVTLEQVMSDIQNADPRFSYTTGWGVSDIIFLAGSDTLSLSLPASEYDYTYWWSNVNGLGAQNSYDALYLHNGDFVKWGDSKSGAALAYDEYGYASEMVWTTPVHPVSVPPAALPTEATIDASDILYWVGNGDNRLVMAVSWAEPDTALAWGYRFSADSVTLEQVMSDIQNADPRFSYTTGWGVSDIIFLAGSDTLSLSLPASEYDYTYWWSNVNGLGAQSTYDALYLHNGDFVKWGDSKSGAALAYDEYGYASEMVWTTPVHPVSVPASQHGPFCGAVGSEGCNAIQYSDSRILGWATSCHLDLGYTDIANPSTLVSYGDSTAAIGASTGDNLAVVSLGDGGMATLSFEHPIANGEGYDFAVFENSFDDNFLELAFVEVSSDGDHFVRFPATSLTPTDTQVGSYGSVDPTFINNLAGKYRVGWGTPFDLDELRDSADIDINNIRFVRIVDVVGSIDPQYGSRDAFGHMVNDPYPTTSYSGGFDLDAVAVMHFAETQSIDDVIVEEMRIYPNPACNSVMCQVEGEGSHNLTIYDMTGRTLMQQTFVGTQTRINLSSISNGVYMIRVDGKVQRLVVRK